MSIFFLLPQCFQKLSAADASKTFARRNEISEKHCCKRKHCSCEISQYFLIYTAEFFLTCVLGNFVIMCSQITRFRNVSLLLEGIKVSVLDDLFKEIIETCLLSIIFCTNWILQYSNLIAICKKKEINRKCVYE